MAQCDSSPTLTSSVVSISQSLSTTTDSVVVTSPASVITTSFGRCSTVAPTSTVCGFDTTVVTRPAETYTRDNVVTVTVNVPFTFLFGSSCSQVSHLSTWTSPPSVSTLTSSSIFTSDGSTFTTVIMSTSTSVPVQTTTDSNNPTSSTSNVNIPAVVGGVLGGISALVLLGLLVWKFRKKPSCSYFDRDDKNFQDSSKQDQPTDPYRYDPIGQVNNSQSIAQPFSNDTGNETAPDSHRAMNRDSLGRFASASNNGAGIVPTGNETGLQSGHDVMYNDPVHNLQNPSLAPLRVGYAPNAGYAPQQLTPHSPPMALYAHQQSYGQGRDQRLQNLSHNLSVGSTVTMSTTSGTGGNNSQPNVDFMSTHIVPHGLHHQQPYQQHYGDASFQAQGPVNPQNPQMFHDRNAEPDTFVQGSSTAFSTPSLSVVGSSSVDDQGRPLDTRGEKATLVYLDGRAYEETAPPAYQE